MRVTTIAARLLVAAGRLRLGEQRIGVRDQGFYLGRILRRLRHAGPGVRARNRPKVATERGPSMGETPQAIPNRLARGESADVGDHGRLRARRPHQERPCRRRQPGRSCLVLIAMAVKAGAPKPDIAQRSMRSSARCWRQNRSPIRIGERRVSLDNFIQADRRV